MDRSSRRSSLNRLLRSAERPLPAFTVRLARRHLAAYPDDAVAWVILGEELVGLARYEEAEQALSKAIEHCPPEKLFLPLGHMGHLFREAGDYDEAARWYRKAVDAAPEEAGSRIFLGAVLAKQGRFAEAEKEHREATRCVDGCVDEAYLNLGLILRARERFGEAADCFREAIRRDPDYRAAKVALRDVERCLRLGRHE